MTEKATVEVPEADVPRIVTALLVGCGTYFSVTPLGDGKVEIAVRKDRASTLRDLMMSP